MQKYKRYGFYFCIWIKEKELMIKLLGFRRTVVGVKSGKSFG